MKTKTSALLLSIAAIVAAAIAGCSDSTGPETRDSGDLHFVRFAASAPKVLDTTATFWAKKGENREIRLRYAPVAGSTQTEEFLRFEVPGDALLRRPDGTLFARDDSVLITVRVADLSRLVFEFQPSGLVFNPTAPARLKIEFAHGDDDLNEDGRHDSSDDALRAQLGIWKQEAPGLPWIRLVDVLKLETSEVEANILGFTGYALAY